jgi:hypothetical protein
MSLDKLFKSLAERENTRWVRASFGFGFGPSPTLYRIADCDGLFWWFARCDLGLDVLVSRCF